MPLGPRAPPSRTHSELASRVQPVPSWASVASDHPSEPPVQGCVVGKLARWLGAVECLSCSACGCGCLPPLIIIIKYNLAEGGWGELSGPPPRLPGSTGRGPCVVSCSTLFCHPLSQSRGHLPRRMPGDHPGVHSPTHTRGTRLFWGGLLAPLQLQVDLEGSTEISWSRKEGSGHSEWLCQREGASSDQPLSQPGALG